MSCFCGKESTFTIEFGGVIKHYCREHGIQKSREIHKEIYRGVFGSSDAIERILNLGEKRMTEKKDICEGCAFNVGGCQCQRFMAAGCIPTYDTTLNEILGIGEKKK